MARNGRKFEQLIAKLETLLADSDVEILRNAKLPDKITGGRREIDILIRGKLGGSHFIDVILECRDRNAKSDVRWMEELRTKRDAVGAHKVVAVSSKPLTKEAAKAATAYNISVRTLSDIRMIDVSEWMDVSKVTVIEPRPKITGVHVLVCKTVSPTLEAQTKLKRRLNTILNERDGLAFYDEKHDKALSVTELSKMVRVPDEVIRDLADATNITFSEFNYKIDCRRSPLQIIGMNDFLICELVFRIRVHLFSTDFAPIAVQRYMEGAIPLSYLVKFVVHVDGRDIQLDFIKNAKQLVFEASEPLDVSFRS